MAAAKKAAPEPEDNSVRIKIQGKSYEIDPTDLTWGEVGEAELYFDQSISEIDFETGRGTMFIAYIARRRVEPSFTVGDMERLRIADVEFDTEERPTDSGDADSGTPS